MSAPVTNHEQFAAPPGAPPAQQTFAAPPTAAAPATTTTAAAAPVVAADAPVHSTAAGTTTTTAAPAVAPAAGTTTTAAAAAPAAAGTTAAPANAKSGPIDNRDMDHWRTRFNTLMSDPAATIKSKAPADARDWDASFCGCLDPIDSCCLAYCCPCILFGRTHHRLHKNNDMQGYEPINTSCLLFLGAACVGVHWIPEAMQRAHIRNKYNLKGSCIGDLLRAACCVLCDLTQQDKESKREAVPLVAPAQPEQYKTDAAGMNYEQKV